MARTINLLLALLGVSLVLATGGVALLAGQDDDRGESAGASPAEASATKTDRVEIKGFKFMPAAVEVKAGSKVTFVNDDSAGHTATSKTAGTFDTDRIKQGESKSVTLGKPGEFDYICAYHPTMKGKIRVVR